jgi:5-methylcytosine-specific restriction endonuclease McrA
MSIITKVVEINLSSRNILHYEKLNYKIPKHFNQNKWRVCKGTKIFVNVEDLQKESNVKILCKCDKCCKERKVFYYAYRDICFKCSLKTYERNIKIKNSKTGKMVGENNSNYRNHKLSGKNNPFYNQHHSDINKEKISKIHKGKVVSDQTKLKLSKIRKGKYVGEKHPNWNSNITHEERLIKRNYIEYIEWRKQVYERDNYTCQKCGTVGGRLNAHHKESYASNKKLRVDINNGVTMCITCHKEFHKLYGNKNNILQFYEFISARNNDAKY